MQTYSADYDAGLIELGSISEMTNGLPPYPLNETQGMMVLTGRLADD